jgi:hypothetical protein
MTKNWFLRLLNKDQDLYDEVSKELEREKFKRESWEEISCLKMNALQKENEALKVQVKTGGAVAMASTYQNVIDNLKTENAKLREENELGKAIRDEVRLKSSEITKLRAEVERLTKDLSKEVLDRNFNWQFDTQVTVKTQANEIAKLRLLAESYRAILAKCVTALEGA